MTEVRPDFPGVSLFWELDHDGVLTLAIRAPMVYASKFRLPGDILYQFLAAIQAQGIDIEVTDEVRVRFDKRADAFLVRWTGQVAQNSELVHDVIPALTRQLGITAHGDS